METFPHNCTTIIRLCFRLVVRALCHADGRNVYGASAHETTTMQSTSVGKVKPKHVKRLGKCDIIFETLF